MGKLPYNLSWILLAVAAIGLTVYIALLRQRERQLASGIANMRRSAEVLTQKLKRQAKRGTANVKDAGLCLGSERSKDERLQAMLRECTSRDDFLVREGPRIVWSELAGGSTEGKSLAVYVPAGMHRLRFGAGERGDSDSGGRAAPHGGNQALGCILGPNPEVYEIQFLTGAAEGEPKVVVLGSDNKIILRRVIPRVSRSRELHLETASDGFAFPSEVKFTDDAGRNLRLPLSPPVTELATFQTTSHWRIWIESNTRPCVSAIAAAWNYDQAALLGDADQLRWKKSLRQDSDAEFTRRFLPYDGSGVLFLRENMIFSPHD